MKATRRWVCLAFALLAAPIGARAAEDEATRFQALEERMRVLEDKLAASSATIEAQQELLNRAAPDVAADGSGLDAFLSKLEVGGSVTGSYLYNFNRPSITAGATAAQPLNQFNSRHNEFSFDAAKIDLSKAAANPGEAGFGFEMLYGQNGDILRNASPTSTAGVFGDSDMGVFVQEAYASYNLSGVTFKMGKFETLLGYEVLDSYKNPNVTQGLLFTWAIPLYHTGLLASGSLAEGLTWSAGVVNGFNNAIENNDGKAFVGQVAMTSGPLFGALNLFWGAETADPPNPGQPGTRDDLKILDAVFTYAPSDTVSFWLNGDYGMQDNQAVAGQVSDKDADYWGVAIGGKAKMSDKVSIALRGEYLTDDDGLRTGGVFPAIGAATDNSEIELYSLTGTVSYMLSQNLMMRGELRWDHAADDLSAPSGAVFPDGNIADANLDDSAVLGLLEVSYIFD